MNGSAGRESRASVDQFAKKLGILFNQQLVFWDILIDNSLKGAICSAQVED